MSLLASSAPNFHGNTSHMDGFPVKVYRKTEIYGWQLMRPKNAQGRRVKVKASPKQGCIVLHRIQVRVRLSLPLSKDSMQENEGKSGRLRVMDDTATNDVLVVRRRHCILISSKSRSRSLIFKFNDLKSCLQFSDQLVQLNPHQTVPVIPNINRNYGKSWDGRSVMKEHNSDESGGKNDTQQALSYVARLLCDDQFVTFCNDLESNLLSSEDGLQMFQSLIDQTKTQHTSKEILDSDSIQVEEMI
jgi:hypothetical protein